MRSTNALGLVCLLAAAGCDGRSPVSPPAEERIDEATRVLETVVSGDLIERILPAFEQRALAQALAADLQRLQTDIDGGGRLQVASSITAVRRRVEEGMLTSPIGSNDAINLVLVTLHLDMLDRLLESGTGTSIPNGPVLAITPKAE